MQPITNNASTPSTNPTPTTMISLPGNVPALNSYHAPLIPRPYHTVQHPTNLSSTKCCCPNDSPTHLPTTNFLPSHHHAHNAIFNVTIPSTTPTKPCRITSATASGHTTSLPTLTSTQSPMASALKQQLDNTKRLLGEMHQQLYMYLSTSTTTSNSANQSTATKLHLLETPNLQSSSRKILHATNNNLANLYDLLSTLLPATYQQTSPQPPVKFPNCSLQWSAQMVLL